MKKKSVIFFFVSEKEFIDGSKSMAYSQPLCHTSHPEIKKGMVFSSSKPTNLIYKYAVQQYWASLVAQLVKNPPVMRETWVQSLGWKDPLEKGKATHTSILAWRIPWTVLSMGLQSWTRLGDFHFHFFAFPKAKNSLF